jgi:hypothetical protein
MKTGLHLVLLALLACCPARAQEYEFLTCRRGTDTASTRNFACHSAVDQLAATGSAPSAPTMAIHRTAGVSG